MNIYKRQSWADLEEKIDSVLGAHEAGFLSEGHPSVPGKYLLECMHKINNRDGLPTFDEDAITHWAQFVEVNPEFVVNKTMLLAFLDAKAQVSPQESPDSDHARLPSSQQPLEDDDEAEYQAVEDALQLDEDLDDMTISHRRAGSEGPYSRPPSRGGDPVTPLSAKSPFDAAQRQRSTPLVAPSAWTAKRPKPARRKSDAGNPSDSESSLPPTAFRRSTSRTQSRSRAPSNPTSPHSAPPLDFDSVTFSPMSSPTPYSRPSSRQAAGFGSLFYGSSDNGYTSQDDGPSYASRRRGGSLPPEEPYEQFNTVPLPRRPRSDDESDYSNSDDEEIELDMVGTRDIKPSDASMADYERLEALQKANRELQRKKHEAEELLNRRITEHETEVADFMQKIEQIKEELSATKREEKELRGKERSMNAQIAALEADVTKINKQLEHAKNTYGSLQRQYQEQIAHADKYRQDLRDREDQLRALRESLQLTELDRDKAERERARLEEHVANLEHDLEQAQHVFAQLEEQKQENLMLKETIDRLRYDMDELRNNLTAASSGLSRKGSVITGSLSKTLGAELAGKLEWATHEEEPDESEKGDAEEGTVVGDGDFVALEGAETEDEDDVVEEMIIRRRFKGQTGVNRSQHKPFVEAKEYADCAAQHDPTEFCISHSTQTEPEPKVFTSSFSTQTLRTPVGEFAIQTEDEERPRLMTMEMEIQTDPVEEEEQPPSRSPSPTPVETESLASSTSTVVPPTPRALPRKTLPGVEESDLPDASPSGSVDEPPAYHAHNWAVVSDVLKKWHNGVKIPVPADCNIEGGVVSEELVEEWKTLKQELGVECLVIDKIIANSKVTSGSHPSAEGGQAQDSSRRSRFYNIYNTYVFGDKSGSSASSKTLPASLQLAANLLTQAAFVAGASALVMLAAAPYLADATNYAIPGGATYYDRSAWSSFNNIGAAGEGFTMGGDNTDAVWNILGRVVGGGVARVARGWPT